MTAVALTIISLVLTQTPPREFQPATTDFSGPALNPAWRTISGDWIVENGAARQQSTDAAAMVLTDWNPTASFRAGIRFNLTPSPLNLSDDSFTGRGAGLILAPPGDDVMAPDAATLSGAIFVRTSGALLIWGRITALGLHRIEGTFGIPDFDPDGPHDISLAVDTALARCNVEHNGARIASNLPAPAGGARIGLIATDGCAIRQASMRAPDAAELAGAIELRDQGRVVDLVGWLHGLIALRDDAKCLIRFDKGGATTHAVNVAGLPLPDGRSFEPTAIAWAKRDAWPTGDDVLVLAEGGGTLYRFSETLEFKSRTPLADDMRGVGMVVSAAGRLFVADADLPGVRIFDKALKPVAAYGRRGSFDPEARPVDAAEKFMRPCAIDIDSTGRIHVLDAGNETFVIYRFVDAAPHLEFIETGPRLPRPFDFELNRQNQIVISGALRDGAPHGALRTLQPGGRPFSSLVGYTMGVLSPHCKLTLGPTGRFVLADPQRDNLLLLSYRFAEPAFSPIWAGENSARINVQSADWGPQGPSMTTITNVNIHPMPTSQPAWADIRVTRHPAETWPRTPIEELPTIHMPLAPQDGRNWVVDFPVTVAVFCKTTRHGQTLSTVDPESVRVRLARELERSRTFVFRNSWAAINVQFEYEFITDPVDVVGDRIPMAVARGMIDARRAARGLPPLRADDCAIAIHAVEDWDAGASDPIGDAVDAPMLSIFGYASYPLVNRGQAWLMCRALHSQLERYCDRSGVGELWSARPDGTFKDADFGPYWDYAATAMRAMSRMHWLRIRYGRFRSIPDADGDGLADADNDLPFDEPRMHSDPRKADTDGDGLNDLAEAMAGIFARSGARKPDTDGDGLKDKDDPHPRHAVASRIARAQSPQLDGTRQPSEYDRIGAIQGAGLEAIIYASYGQNRLHVAAEFANRIDRLVVRVDGRGNGWFVGDDNTTAVAEINWDDSAAPKTATLKGCEAVVRTTPSGHILELDIPLAAMHQTGPNRTLGLILSIERDPDHTAFLIDPWDVLSLKLK